MITKQELFDFVDRAGKATYAGGGSYEEHPERPGFFELVYEEAPLSYRDSYSGHARSGGQEIVRYEGKPIWWSGYGGGMIDGKETLSDVAFQFLKKALSQDEEGFDSLRGPHEFTDGDWIYTYIQDGDITDFYGYEVITYKGEKVFWHRAVGGIQNMCDKSHHYRKNWILNQVQDDRISITTTYTKQQRATMKVRWKQFGKNIISGFSSYSPFSYAS